MLTVSVGNKVRYKELSLPEMTCIEAICLHMKLLTEQGLSHNFALKRHQTSAIPKTAEIVQCNRPENVHYR